MLRGMSSELAKPFIARWAAATASERANSQPFLCELCDVLGVARPEPTRGGLMLSEFGFDVAWNCGGSALEVLREDINGLVHTAFHLQGVHLE